MNALRVLSTLSLLFLLSIGSAWATGTVMVTVSSSGQVVENGDQFVELLFTFTADAADGSFPTGTIDGTEIAWTNFKGWRVTRVIAVKGAVAPTAALDLVINETYNSVALDILGGNGADLSVTAVNEIFPTAPKVVVPVERNLSVVLTNNSVNSAVVYIYVTLSA